MVKISYCANCQKAYRFHFKKRFICRTCKEPFENIEVPRTKYFLIQLPLVVVGFIIIAYSAFLIAISDTQLVEPLGYFIFGFAFVLFALAFQIMDNKNMESHALDMGRNKFEDGVPNEAKSSGPTKFLSGSQRKITSELIVKKPKKVNQPNELFTSPNKPSKQRLASTGIIGNRNKKEPTQVKLEVLMKSGQKTKKARKIRRAL
jgi:hypothetical protein